MQEQLLHAAEPGRRPGVDLRRPKGYAAAAPSSNPKTTVASAAAADGEPCPRCESRNTKFCYYNNYNTSQPRHFCKGCRRYWTKGGTLRSVPVGGGTRKRPASSSSSPSAASVKKPYKKRRAATAPEPSVVDDDVVTASPADAVAKVTEPTTTTPPTEASAASEITTELVVPAVVADEDSFTDLLQHGGDDDAVALDLGFSDYPVGGKALLGDAYSFDWPPALDLGACWGGAGFADPDPGVFMNLP